MIMCDPLLFQATINFAAAHIDILQGIQHQCKGTQALQMKAKTIKMINEQLNSSDTAVSNSSIGAVAMLAAAEVSSVSPYSIQKPNLAWKTV